MEALKAPDPPENRPQPRISQYATSRQRLSVQSLLLQSDFVDDSDQIAIPAPNSTLHYRRSDAGIGSGGAVTNGNGDVPPLDDRMSLDGIQDESITPHDLEDAGAELNPWMGGFPSKDDVYGIPGLPGDLDQEY